MNGAKAADFLRPLRELRLNERSDLLSAQRLHRIHPPHLLRVIRRCQHRYDQHQPARTGI